MTITTMMALEKLKRAHKVLEYIHEIGGGTHANKEGLIKYASYELEMAIQLMEPPKPIAPPMRGIDSTPPQESEYDSPAGPDVIPF